MRSPEEWLKVADVPLPDRLSLRSVDAWNLGKFPESRITEGFTLDEIRAYAKARVVLPNSVEIIQNWKPENPRSVALGMHLDIGWDDDPGTSLFTAYVVTNDLRACYGRKWRSLMFVDTFEWPRVLAGFLNIMRKCERPTSEESFEKLSSRFDWEYAR